MSIKAARIVAGPAALAALASLTLCGAPRATAAVTYQQIMNWHSGKCLDVAGGSHAIGARVQQYTCNGTPAQQWTKEPTNNGFFLLRVAVSGQCLQVQGGAGSFDDNQPVVQMPCNRLRYDQQWTDQYSS